VEILFDTHTLLWWLDDDPILSKQSRSLISNPANTLVVSAATAWEIAIKQALGKLTLDANLENEARDQGFELLPVTFAHARELRILPPIHRDPFDRMLVAQARVENLALLTDDPKILGYPANVIRNRPGATESRGADG
jgi:PIN domain nuclease of toxin-antitoxin system